MADRKNLENNQLGSTFRGRLNDNMQEALRPSYLVAWDLAPAHAENYVIQTVSSKTWTNIISPTFTNESGASIDGAFEVITLTVFLDPDSGDDCSGTWLGSMTAGWDNQTSGLEAHMRQIRWQVWRSDTATWTEVTRNTTTFNPDGVSSPIDDEEKKQLQQMFFQWYFENASGVTHKVRCQAWHNATVGGSPVSLNLVKAGAVAPLWMLGRKNNYEAT